MKHRLQRSEIRLCIHCQEQSRDKRGRQEEKGGCGRGKNSFAKAVRSNGRVLGPRGSSAAPSSSPQLVLVT